MNKDENIEQGTRNTELWVVSYFVILTKEESHWMLPEMIGTGRSSV